MKKILLTVMAVMLTAGAMAQNTVQTLGKLEATAFRSATPVKAMQAKKLPAMKAGEARPAAKAAPQGTEKVYYLDYVDYLYNLGTTPRYHVSANIVFGDNNKVYLQNMIYTSMIEGVWIEGTLSADGSEISIANEQLLADIQGQKLYLCKMLIDDATGQVSADKANEVKLSYDKATGIITTKDESILGVFDEGYSGFYTLLQGMTYIPGELFPAATEHDYTCTYESQQGLDTYNGKVKMINIEDICYINGLMPDYPDSWVAAQATADGITIPSYQAIFDDTGMAFITAADGQIAQEYTLTLDNATDSYKSESGYALVDLFASQDGGLGYSVMHSDISLKKTGTAGIGNAVTGDEGKEVVKSELFDLSGRRVSDTQKGVVIKVTKYADGSSNTTKIIK